MESYPMAALAGSTRAATGSGARTPRATVRLQKDRANLDYGHDGLAPRRARAWPGVGVRHARPSQAVAVCLLAVPAGVPTAFGLPPHVAVQGAALALLASVAARHYPRIVD